MQRETIKLYILKKPGVCNVTAQNALGLGTYLKMDTLYSYVEQMTNHLSEIGAVK